MTSSTTPDRWTRRLFFLLAVLYVLPFWTVRYIPTTDGPCHTYNAWVLRQSGNVEQYPLFQQYYKVDWRPFPNWTGHAVMAALMFVVPPLVAEKILVSGYVLLLLGGTWYLAGAVRPEERWPAFLAFPFVYNQLFQYGFYNFSLSLGAYLFALGYWWRHRDRLDLRFAVGINLLLWLCWFCHVLSFCLALGSIAVLWLATLRRDDWRRHLLHVPILLPQLPLPLWFFQVQGGGMETQALTLRQLREYLVPPRVLFTFSQFQVRLAAWVAAGFLILVLLTVWRLARERRLGRADVFLLLAAGLAFLFFVAPPGAAGGALVTERLSLYPYLVLIPWLAPGLGRRGKLAGVALLALLAVVDLGYLLRWYRALGAELAEFETGLEPVQPNSRVLTLLFERRFEAQFTDVFSHATSYAALEKGLIDWGNYEAKTGFFPVRFRDGVQFPILDRTDTEPSGLRVRANRSTLDAIYTWRMPPGDRLRWRLRRDYERVSVRYGGELHERLPARQTIRSEG